MNRSPARRSSKATPAARRRALRGAAFLLTGLTLVVLAVVVLTLVVIAPVASVAAASDSDEVMVDGILHVRNGASPSQGIETMHLEELWRVGGEDDDILLGVILQVRTDEEGNIYLLDSQLSQVQVYSSDGQFLHTLSREGDGPGEIRRPADLVLLPDGEVGLLRNFPGKVIKVDRQGNPAGTIDVGADPTGGGFSILRAGRCRGGNLVFGATDVVQGDRPGVQNRTSFLASHTAEGEKLVTYLTHDYVFDFQNFRFDERDHIDWALRRFDIAPDGRVFCATERDRYSVTVFNTDGSVERVIERDYAIEQRSNEERQELHELLEAALREIPFEFEITIEESEPPISWLQNGIRVDADGSLWVLSNRGVNDQPDGIMQTYDVFDPGGRFVKQVAVACDGTGREDYLFFTAGDRVVLVRGFVDALRAAFGGGATDDEEAEEPEPMEVICYAVRS